MPQYSPAVLLGFKVEQGRIVSSPWSSHTLWKSPRATGLLEEEESGLKDPAFPPPIRSVERGCPFAKGASRASEGSFHKFRVKHISLAPEQWKALKMRFWWLP